MSEVRLTTLASVANMGRNRAHAETNMVDRLGVDDGADGIQRIVLGASWESVVLAVQLRKEELRERVAALKRKNDAEADPDNKKPRQPSPDGVPLPHIGSDEPLPASADHPSIEVATPPPVFRKEH